MSETSKAVHTVTCACDTLGAFAYVEMLESYVPRSEGTAKSGRYGHAPIIHNTRTAPAPAFGQDSARGILAVNPYAEGSHEWHAWGLGFEWESQTFAPQTSAETLVAGAMGFDVDDFSVEDCASIVAAWHTGQDAYRAGWR